MAVSTPGSNWRQRGNRDRRANLGWPDASCPHLGIAVRGGRGWLGNVRYSVWPGRICVTGGPGCTGARLEL